MSNYKIVFIDIDDTLNKVNELVSKETIEVMDLLQKKDILTVINSGRDLEYAIKKSEEGHLSRYVISSNGTEVYDREENKIIYNAPINKFTIKEIYDYCIATNMTIYLNANRKRYCSRIEKNTYFIENIDKIVEENAINQLVITSKNYDRMLVLPNLFEERYKDIYVVHSSISLTEKKRVKDMEYYHDIVVKNNSKSTGLLELLDYLDIDNKEAIAIGNGYDDISMMEVVGYSAAVGNAVQALKERTRITIGSVEENGAAQFLKKIYMEEKDEAKAENR